MSRAARRTGALLALIALSATACRLDVAVEVDVTDEGSGTVMVEAVADRALVEAEPDALQELRFDDATASGWTVEGPRRRPDGSAVVRLRKPFANPEQANRILRELNGPDGPLTGLELTQERRFARTTTGLTGHVRLDGGTAAFADPGLVALTGGVPFADRVEAAGTSVADALGLTLTVRAPGVASTTTTGTADGGTVTWHPPLAEGATTELRASWIARDEQARRAAQWRDWSRRALVGWVALVAMAAMTVLAVWAVRRLRHRA